MDWITACYYSKMRPYRDRPDIEINGRWHWCPEGAKVIPFRHLFPSFTMDDDSVVVDGGIGEVPHKNGRSRGESDPRYDGQHFCGTEEDWTQGSLWSTRQALILDAGGIPLCCSVEVPPLGGIELDGESDQGAPAGGGVESGGDGQSANLLTLVMDGGIEMDGEFPPSASMTLVMEGGIEGDGDSPPEPRTPTVTGAGIEFGEDGMHPVARRIDTDGGVEFGEDGMHPVARRIDTDGGVEFGGDGQVPVELVTETDGGIELDGDAQTPFAAVPEIDGGIELDGATNSLNLLTLHMDGGIELGGPDPTSTFRVQTIACPDQLQGNVKRAWFDLVSGPGGPSFNFPLVYDPADQRWKGSYGITGPGISLAVEWWANSPGDNGMRASVTATGTGESTFGDPVVASCGVSRWLYQMFGGFVLAGYNPANAWYFFVLDEPPAHP